MIQQSQQIVPPQPSDKNLRDFAQIMQLNMAALFLAGHVHKLVTSDPIASTGNIGDIYLVDGASKYIAVKFSSGWFKIGPLTAI